MLVDAPMVLNDFIRQITITVISQNRNTNSPTIMWRIFWQKYNHHSAELCIGMQWRVVISIVALNIEFDE